jgi:hypothetical protein
MANSTAVKSFWRLTWSATAPAKRARKLSAMRAADTRPTRKGESVRVRTNHADTSASICDPIAARVTEDHTRP